MILYAVIGTADCPGGADSHGYFYGVFSTKKKANQIIKDWFDLDNEELSVEEIEVDKPTEMYDIMMAD